MRGIACQKDLFRWWALGGLNLAVLAVGLDASILAVALPTLASALHASESDLQWFSSGYFLSLAAAMLPAGLLGDRYGRKKILIGALLLFGVGSIACAYSSSPSAFVAARVLLGLSGAGVVVMSLTVFTVLFSPEERPRAIGIWAATNFISLPIGPVLGGWLLSHYWWGWVFLINAPVVLIGLIATAILVPESSAPERPSLDWLGISSSIIGLTALTYGLIEAGRRSWANPVTLTWIGVGVVILGGFFWWERRLTRSLAQPLIDFELFHSQAFTWGVLLNAIIGLILAGFLFIMPQYFQGIRGADALGSGFRLLLAVAGMVMGALPADQLARWMGAKITVAVGCAISGLGLVIGASTGTDSTDAFVGLWMTLVGAGLGLSATTASSCALSELSEEGSGVGAAIQQAALKIGGPLGSAILGSVLNSTYQGNLSVVGLSPTEAQLVRESLFTGLAVAARIHSPLLAKSIRSAFVHGMDLSLLVSAVLLLGAMLLALAFLPNRPFRQRDRGSQEPIDVEAAFVIDE